MHMRRENDRLVYKKGRFSSRLTSDWKRVDGLKSPSGGRGFVSLPADAFESRLGYSWDLCMVIPRKVRLVEESSRGLLYCQPHRVRFRTMMLVNGRLRTRWELRFDFPFPLSYRPPCQHEWMPHRIGYLLYISVLSRPPLYFLACTACRRLKAHVDVALGLNRVATGGARLNLWTIASYSTGNPSTSDASTNYILYIYIAY